MPGMAAFLDAVAALLDTINSTPGVPAVVEAGATRVRAEALGIGGEVVIDDGDRSPVQVGNEERLRAAMHVARGNPGYAVTVDWSREL